MRDYGIPTIMITSVEEEISYAFYEFQNVKADPNYLDLPDYICSKLDLRINFNFQYFSLQRLPLVVQRGSII